MLSHATARRASAPSALASSKVEEIRKETSPEEPHHEGAAIVEVDEKKNQVDDKKNQDDVDQPNNQEDDEEQCRTGEDIALEDVHLDLAFDATSFVPPPALATSWIVSWDKRAIWHQTLADGCPHKPPSTPTSTVFHDKVALATQSRALLLAGRQIRTRAHNQHVLHTRLRREDASGVLTKAKTAQLDEKLNQAATRRERWYLRGPPLPPPPGYDFPVDVPSESTLWETSQRRIAQAQSTRQQILGERSGRAGFTVERAKAVAADVAELHEQYEALATQDLEDRLTRAEVRRLIHLDKRRLIAGRHGNYVKSVYLTNRYMERREAERLDMAMDAAIARRDAHIESIQSRARRHNLSAQFRASCAFRLFDAQWLNKALRGASAQQAADVRRDHFLQTRVAALQDAALRRHNVARARNRATIERSHAIGSALSERQRSASERRQAQLEWTRDVIAARRDYIRARKINEAHQTKRLAKRYFLDKVEQATKRREAIVERRRASAATRNWYAKVLAHRQVEARAEASAVAALQIEEKLEAAAYRRQENQRPLFSELVSLRLKRVGHVLNSHHQLLARLSSRKEALASIRLAEMDHERAQSWHAKWLHTQQVKERRDHDLVFRQQCVASHAFARLRSAEIRRALAQDAIRMNVEEDRARGEAARLRLHIVAEETKAFLEFRLVRAEEKRAARRAEKVSAAIWFKTQGQLARNRQLLRREKLRVSSLQAVAEASLRRSIGLTVRARKYFVERAVVATRQNCMKLVLSERDAARDTKQKQADARRSEILTAKQQSARRTIDRVMLTRLERQSTAVVDAAIQTAMQATVALQAEARRVEALQARQRGARERSQNAKKIARSQKAKWRLETNSKLEESQLRVEETTQRREALLAARKLGKSTIERLQPYAGLRVVGKAVTLWPNVAA
ncbi:Aste57867_2615 [Aphanomyces stellatus]|uniref:Aste57867_2615 protein n=1 Tax=Aphanomyces stellatus TaxID=120398 RepID=A0A485K7X4_9STRA|nr:hypothetical protein As57867_002608 [Aphanomyces stellatus]VFT79811.1 Aste57867_2615 [Aphanomyces stellatus]